MGYKKSNHSPALWPVAHTSIRGTHNKPVAHFKRGHYNLQVRAAAAASYVCLALSSRSSAKDHSPCEKKPQRIMNATMKCHILISRRPVADPQTLHVPTHTSLREVADTHPRHGIATALKAQPNITYPLKAGPTLKRKPRGRERTRGRRGIVFLVQKRNAARLANEPAKKGESFCLNNVRLRRVPSFYSSHPPRPKNRSPQSNSGRVSSSQEMLNKKTHTHTKAQLRCVKSL